MHSLLKFNNSKRFQCQTQDIRANPEGGGRQAKVEDHIPTLCSVTVLQKYLCISEQVAT